MILILILFFEDVFYIFADANHRSTNKSFHFHQPHNTFQTQDLDKQPDNFQDFSSLNCSQEVHPIEVEQIEQEQGKMHIEQEVQDFEQKMQDFEQEVQDFEPDDYKSYLRLGYHLKHLLQLSNTLFGCILFVH